MSFGLGIKGALGGAAQGASIGSAIPGIGTAIGGAIGGGLGLLGGLFGGGSNTKDQEKLMEKAWEYEKEGMGMQYQYGQAAANAAEKIIKDYERSGQKLSIDEKNSLREWIYGGIKALSSFIPSK